MNLELNCEICGSNAIFDEIQPATAELILQVWGKEHRFHETTLIDLWDERERMMFASHKSDGDNEA